MKSTSLTSFLFLACAACVSTPPEFDLYEVLERSAEDPAMRATVCTIVADHLHPAGETIASTYGEDPDDSVRTACMLWWIRRPSDRQNEWLAKGLRDPSAALQAHAVLNAVHVEPWSAEVQELLWQALETTQRAHVFEAAGKALVQRGGEGVAHQVFGIAHGRGAGWLPYTLPAIVQFPHEDFREEFLAATESDNWNHACLGRRGLDVLEHGSQATEDCQTTAEFHATWRDDSYSDITPQVLAWPEMTAALRSARVIILGELHAAMPARATQISVLAELCHAKLRPVVLVLERPVLEHQKPLHSAANQYRLPVRFLEPEEPESSSSPSERDRQARAALVDMVNDDPESVFLVAYGENHRNSLQAAMRDAGIDSLSITSSALGGMLGSAMQAAKGRIQGLCFAFPGRVYYIPSGSYATILGNPSLDRVFGSEPTISTEAPPDK